MRRRLQTVKCGHRNRQLVSRFDELERLIGQDVGRNISQLVQAVQGQLESATRSIAEHPEPKIAIVTGFFVPTTTPPAAETDGPIGTAILAAVFERSGIPVELVTDENCQSMLHVARDTMRCTAPVVTVSSAEEVEALKESYLTGADSVSHVLSIERPGPAASGRVRNFKGRDLTDVTAPLHKLFEPAVSDRAYATIAIGDGGNEIGMGRIDPAVVAGNIANGAEIACVTPCDHLIVSGVSNWGGFALAAGVASLMPRVRESVLEVMTPENCNALLEAIVDRGPAVDAIVGAQQYTIDGLPAQAHDEVLQAVLNWLKATHN